MQDKSNVTCYYYYMFGIYRCKGMRRNEKAKREKQRKKLDFMKNEG